MKITVLGAGAWGTALGKLLQVGQPHQVTLWGHVPAWVEEIRQTRRNERFLPGIELPQDLALESSLSTAIAGAECVVVAVPSQPFREVTGALADFRGTVISVTRGSNMTLG
jgi:glycerol-3-phosphate dehydrogenase (NAD(P)+)